METLHPLALLTTAQMTAADNITIGRGTDGYTLMLRAGMAVVSAIEERFAKGNVVVLAGPGNNGGDGFVVAQALFEKGWPVRVGLLGESEALKGDAARAAAAYKGELHPLHPFLLNEQPLVVDALFGAGLSRPIEGIAAEVLEKIRRNRLQSIAVDIPSGIDGNTGQVLGTVAPAVLTVTFHRKKRGHVLQPGAGYCGDIVVADIGIDPSALVKEDITVYENGPLLWRNFLPFPHAQSHKYTRGHAVVQGGGLAHTGAARMAARAALRGGAGAVTVACDTESLPVYATAFEAVMTRVVADEQALIDLLKDERISAYLIGPGAGVNERTLAFLLTALAMKKPVVLDADALSVAAQKPQVVFDALRGISAILTPHAGEFKRLFGTLADADKITATQQAATLCGAVVVHKGADTVIAAPDGRVVVNSLPAPWLATAGAGDVLSGLCCGLLAGKMPAFEAACAAAWMHSSAAIAYGAGLIAEDLPDILPRIWQDLYESSFYACK